MKSLAVYPQFFAPIENGFCLIGLHRVEAIINALVNKDEEALKLNLFVTEEDDYPCYEIKVFSKNQNTLLVINEKNLIPLTAMECDFNIYFGGAVITLSNGLKIKLTLDYLRNLLIENKWRLELNPTKFFDCEAMNIEHPILPYTMLHAPSNLMSDNFIYFLMNEFFNLEMINYLSEKMNERWLADCENDEYYDEDLLKIKIADMVASLTCANGQVLGLEFDNPTIHNPKGHLVVSVTHNEKQYHYLVIDSCDSEINQLRDKLLTELNK